MVVEGSTYGHIILLGAQTVFSAYLFSLHFSVMSTWFRWQVHQVITQKEYNFRICLVR